MASTIEDQTEGDNGPSMVMMLIVYAVITLIAGGAGFGVSATLLKPASFSSAPQEVSAAGATAASAAQEPAAHETANAHGGEAAQAAAPAAHGEAQKLVVVDLPSITTNLIDPTDAWIRLELSLVFADQSDKQLAQDVQQDILAYVHTMKLYNLRGGSGYQHLIEDLEERAAIRSEGRIKQVLVRSLILE